MKHWLSLFICTLLLVGCGAPATVTNTPFPPTLSPSSIATEPPPPTPLPPMVDVKIKEVIGEQEYGELSASIGQNGEIKVADYGMGNFFEGKIKAETIGSKTTADWHFGNIITAQARDEVGKTFKVVWNPDSNHWVEVTAINTDLMDKENYTHFNNIDTMVENGDLDLVLLSQGDFAQPFPDTVETAQYWMSAKHWGIIANGKVIEDYYLYLNSNRQDYIPPPEQIGSEDRQAVANGSFTKGKEPYRPAAVLKGKTKDGKDIYLIPNILQNTDKTNIFNYLGFDPRFFEYIANDHPETPVLKTIFINNGMRPVPIIPTAHEEDWDNFSKAKENFGSGNNHGILLGGGISYRDDVVVDMQIPGEVFNVLPDYMKQQLEADRELYIKNKKHPFSFKFKDGIPPELARMLSRHIFEAGYEWGSIYPH